MSTYRAALVGCGRIGAFIDNEVVGHYSMVLPYSHAAGYEACARTDLVAGSDLRPDVLAAFGERYQVAPEHRYTDYREMIRAERPDIVSVATQAKERADVALFAIENGVRALYCEKPLCSSLDEAAALVEAVEKHGVAFNMGTNRRWSTGFDAMRATIASGELGALTTLITYSHPTLFNTVSHWFDTLLVLNGDAPVAWVQAHLPNGDECIVGDEVVADPLVQGTIGFANGVTAHLIESRLPIEHEAICERGSIRVTVHDSRFEVRRISPDESESLEALDYAPASSTLRLIEDLVNALDTGEPTRGGIRIAQVNTELLFGFLESHRRHGSRVELPLRQSSLRFSPRIAPRQPKYAP